MLLLWNLQRVPFEKEVMARKSSGVGFPFSKLTGRGVKVAIVDSGIDQSHPKVGPVSGGADISIGAEGQIVYVEEDFTDRAGHGTACAGIIRKKAPAVELYSVRIFDASLSARGEALVAAVRWATENGMNVVNLSLGTTDVAFRESIDEACGEAVEAGVILVAAEHNEGLESYPAVLSGAIGVAGGKIYKKYGYYYRPGERVECVARGDEQRVCWLDRKEILIGGTSYAAPHITGIVALIREAYPGANPEKVRQVLKANALTGAPPLVRQADAPASPPAHQSLGASMPGRSPVSRPPVSLPVPEQSGASGFRWIKRAAFYPFNKEMHGLVRFRDLLSFEIGGIADPVGKGLVGKDAGEAIGIAQVGVRIVPRLQDALKGIDTLILGYVDELARMANRDVLKESIQTALDRGVHVFSFLPVPPTMYSDLYMVARKKALKIVYPNVSQGEVRHILQRPQKQRAVDVPVLGVFGTSSQQGKFTVQLALRRKFLEMGYRVAQIGTEHHAELFGMDLAFPMGYASPLELPLQVYVPYLDHKMKEICQKKEPEIMLVGSQSGTIPYDVVEHDTHSLPTIAFLLATKPDACILVVNSIDPDEYIRDTINAIQALGKTPTILLAMSDKEKHIRAAYGRTMISPRQMSREEIDGKLQHLEGTFEMPAVEIVSEADQQRMVETVIRHFANSNTSETQEGSCQTTQASVVE